MKLTDKELEVMRLLWASKEPLTTSGIIKMSEDRTWKEHSIFVMMNRLISKGAIELTSFIPTMTKTARAYRPLLSAEDYFVAHIAAANEAGEGDWIDFKMLSRKIASLGKK
jgi:predicted transcriptional regulator